MEQQAITEPDVQELLSKILEVVGPDNMEKIKLQMDENKPIAMEYFKTNGWTQQYLKEMECSKDTTTLHFYHLGREKNEAGRCTNCNGVMINARYG